MSVQTEFQYFGKTQDTSSSLIVISTFKYIIMKLFFYGLFLLFCFQACSGEKPVPQPIDPITEIDRRPFLPCNRFTAKQVDSVNNALATEVGRASTPREKTVAAAIFLTHKFPYSIPYAYETSRDGYKYVSRFYRGPGLFLEPFDEGGHTYQPWGCEVPTPAGLYTHVSHLEETFPNGIHCSGFTNWCLYNGGITDIRADTTHANGYQNLPGVTKVDLASAIDELRVGDFLWFDGHVALIIEINGDVVKIAESALWHNDHNDRRNGVKWFMFNRKTINYSTFRFKSLLKMDGVYGEV